MSIREDLINVIPEIGLLENESLREKTVTAWQMALDAAGIQPEALNEMPFSLLARRCGISLAEHIRTVTRSAMALADEMSAGYGNRAKLDRDIVIAGGIVHDIGKVMEYEQGGEGYQKSYYGKMLRHPFSGVWICEKAGLPVEILHIVAVHSKEGDGGHRSLEASIIFHCDFANFESFRD
ncbi:MAG: HD domain-containing protein [Candidatus Coatesbacteria bacterium]|nr:HD domain-containing protein [Candidatus Coatesbacteria bacterium]